MARLLAYARNSNGRHEVSIPTQVSMFDALAKDIDAYWDNRFYPRGLVFADEGRSAMHQAHHERPAMVALKEFAQKDDHIVVWKFSRVDRNYLRLANWMLWVMESGLHLHVVDCLGGRRMDLNSIEAQAIAFGLGIAAQIQGEELRATAKAIHAQLRREGRLSARPRIGFQRKELPPLPGQKKPIIMEVPNEAELNTLKEALHRHQRRESWRGIVRDFKRRGLVSGRGKSWTVFTLPNAVKRLQEYMETGEVV